MNCNKETVNSFVKSFYVVLNICSNVRVKYVHNLQRIKDPKKIFYTKVRIICMLTID